MEKPDDGEPFALHTSLEDRAAYYGACRRPWLTIALVFGALGIARQSAVGLGIGAAALVPVCVYQTAIWRLWREERIRE